MDVGTVLQAPTPVIADGRYLLARERLFHFPDCRMHNWLFGRYPPPGGWFVSPTVAFDKPIVDEMLQLIQTRYGRIPWYDAVLNILNGVPNTRFCAAQAYAGYMESFHQERVTCRTANHIRLPAEQFDRMPADAEIVTFDSDDPAPAPPSVGQKPALRMSSLGVNGRFGNQVFQYAFLRLLAKERGMDAHNPQWIGGALFGHPQQCGDMPLPLSCEFDCSFAPQKELPTSGAELWGYFQYHTSFYRKNQSEFRALFQPVEALARPLEQAVARLIGSGKTLVGIHLRRGDYTGGDFWPAPAQWYVWWLQEIWPKLNRPVLYVASDDPGQVMGDFAAFSAKTTADLGVKLNGAEFYPDFFTLSRCDLLAISNSTFSFAAAMLNTTARQFLRPDPDSQRLEPFDPWDSPVLLQPRRKIAA
jgi:hypothetical protein